MINEFKNHKHASSGRIRPLWMSLIYFAYSLDLMFIALFILFRSVSDGSHEEERLRMLGIIALFLPFLFAAFFVGLGTFFRKFWFLIPVVALLHLPLGFVHMKMSHDLAFMSGWSGRLFFFSRFDAAKAHHEEIIGVIQAWLLLIIPALVALTVWLLESYRASLQGPSETAIEEYANKI